MINPARPGSRRPLLYNSVQTEERSVHDLPPSSILFDSLKTLEIQLQARGIIGQSLGQSCASQPVWFSAETERNIFLWRSGMSLIDADQFEFWVDVETLINKRLDQLTHANSENPFVNPLWGTSVINSEAAAREEEYLGTFLEILKSIQVHANALSLATSEIIQQMYKLRPPQQIVLLPR